MDPLVSVTIPTYNSASTLPLALASVIAQTYQNWECIVVDDGSTDDTAELMEAVHGLDSRFRYIRLPENRGRAVARQTALDNAAGDYLAMVDADDWIYPEKLERQAKLMQATPAVAVLSTGMAIVNATQELSGVRGANNNRFSIFPRLEKPQLPSVAHAPCMIRIEAARAAGYSGSFRRSEDVDFMLSILLSSSYGVLGEALYSYSEHRSLNWRAISLSRINTMRMFAKYFVQFPLSTCRNIGVMLAKLLITVLIGTVGRDRYHDRLRPLATASGRQKKEFYAARHQVLGQRARLLGPSKKHDLL